MPRRSFARQARLLARKVKHLIRLTGQPEMSPKSIAEELNRERPSISRLVEDVLTGGTLSVFDKIPEGPTDDPPPAA